MSDYFVHGGGHQEHTDLDAGVPKLDVLLAEIEQGIDAWWMTDAQSEIARVMPKAIKRGGNDLAEVGRVIARILAPRDDLTHAERIELGIWFYIIGKMGRVQAALERGEWPDEDSLFDLTVYMRMIKFVRANGGWPWAPGKGPPEKELKGEELRAYYASTRETHSAPTSTTWGYKPEPKVE